MAIGRQDIAWDSPDLATHDNDPLEMSKYARALARLVRDCHTPMTVGIQGEWGSGKTSLMNMMRRELRREASRRPLVFTFETWQYGAVEADGTLGVRLVEQITRQITATFAGQDASRYRIGAKASAVMSALTWVARRATARAISSATAGAVQSDEVSAVMDAALTNGPGPRQHDSALHQLKSAFQDLVNEAIGSKVSDASSRYTVDRFVIFIDDLDRIRPGHAVMMLEVMKNFMDVNGCVFVLACDYEVVRLGVRERFRIRDPKKARAFFDKIIQVPFQMPVEAYQIDRMLQSFFLERCQQATGKKRKEEEKCAHNAVVKLGGLVALATGTNPRAFKRFLNVLDLLSLIQSEGVGAGAETRDQGEVRGQQATSRTKPKLWKDPSSLNCRAFVGLVALQTRWPEVANHVASRPGLAELRLTLDTLRGHATDSDDETAAEQGSGRDDDVVQLLTDLYGADWEADDDGADLTTFAKLLFHALDRAEPAGEQGYLDDEELQPVKRWASQLMLTATRQTRIKKSAWQRFRDEMIKSAVGEGSGSDSPSEGANGRTRALVCCELLDAVKAAATHQACRVVRKPDSFTLLFNRQHFEDDRQHGTPKEPTILSASPGRTRIKLNLNEEAARKYGLPGLERVGSSLASAAQSLGARIHHVKTGWYLDLSEAEPDGLQRNELRDLISGMVAELERYLREPLPSPVEESPSEVPGLTGAVELEASTMAAPALEAQVTEASIPPPAEPAPSTGDAPDA